MAELLIEQWRLAVLRVRLDLSARESMVATELVGYPQGRRELIWERSYPCEGFGLAYTTRPPTRLSVPDELREDVRRSLLEDFGGEAALWLRLVPPYGYLGAVPWEEALVPVINRPLLRVPDRLPVAADPGQAWTVAIAVNATPGSRWAAPYLVDLLTALRNRVQVPVDVHVFADAETHSELAADLGDAVHLHDPAVAERANRERSARAVGQFRAERRGLRTAAPPPSSGVVWADWIATGLAGQAVRALHVVSDAVFDVDRPLLAISPDPGKPTDRRYCAWVSPDNIRLVADAIGAAALSFGSPPLNPSDVATRMIADEVGLQRQGPTLYSSIRLDPHGEALARAHAYLANPPGSEPIPQHPSLFAYLQPEHIRASLRDPWPTRTEPDERGLQPPRAPGGPPALAPAAAEEVTAIYSTADWVPTWVAATERYIDTKVADLAQTEPEPGAASPTKHAYNAGTEAALAELRELVARHARQS
jgi:hypothetical protein